jgi:hypothetical protein
MRVRRKAAAQACCALRLRPRVALRARRREQMDGASGIRTTRDLWRKIEHRRKIKRAIWQLEADE